MATRSGLSGLPSWAMGARKDTLAAVRTRLLIAFGLVGVVLAIAVPASGSLVGFQSPSGNIGCYMNGKSARCDIVKHDWVAPPKPPSCELDWGQGVVVGRHGKAEFVCAGDTAINEEQVLGYGESISRGRFRCVSKETKVKCVNERSDHGFKLSKLRVKRS
jgi:hypothetical protein